MAANEVWDYRNVVQDNEMVTARYLNGLRLQDRRLMYLAISMLDQSKARYTENDLRVRVFASEFARAFGITHNDLYGELKTATQRLWHTDFCIYENGRDSRWIHVFAEIGYIESEGFVEMRFTNEVSFYLTRVSNSYTVCQLRQLAKLKSTHSMALYTLCRRFKKTGLLRIPVEEFRRILGIEEAEYGLFSNLRRRVIEPAVAEINANSELNIRFSTTKQGRKVKNLEFRFATESH